MSHTDHLAEAVEPLGVLGCGSSAASWSAPAHRDSRAPCCGVYAGVDGGVSSGLTIGGGCVVLGIALAPIVRIRWSVPTGVRQRAS